MWRTRQGMNGKPYTEEKKGAGLIGMQTTKMDCNLNKVAAMRE